MESFVSWNSKYNFNTQIRNHQFELDAPLSSGGANRGPNPKEILLSSVSTCAGMDIVYLLNGKNLVDLDIKAKAEMTKTKPSVFDNILLSFLITGDITKDDAINACLVSMTKLCGVSAMLTKACPIFYEVHLNGEFLTKAESKFSN